MPRSVTPVVALLAAVLGGVAVGAPAGAADACSANQPFTPAFVSKWNASWGGNAVSATVVDHVTGCVYQFGQTAHQFPEASVAKVEIMAGMLESVQAGKRSLSSVAGWLVPMIEQSDNNAATTLWTMNGGQPGMNAISSRWGLGSTYEGPGIPWGVNLTTTPDQVKLVDGVVGGAPSPLSSASLRSYARSLMTHVNPAQAWGVSAGVPAGWTVALKNGWYPTSSGDYGPAGKWRVNSVGTVWDAQGHQRWTIAVMGNTWSTMATGVSAIQSIAARVAQALSAEGAPAPAPPPPPPPAPAPAPGPSSIPGLPLAKGAAGPAVRRLQAALVVTGAKLSILGVYGPKTQAAVAAFQSSKGLPATGVVDDATWKALFPTVDPAATVAGLPLAKGAKGPLVVAVQGDLVANGMRVSIDGSFGPRTQRAVAAFQTSKGLPATGVVDAATWRALGLPG